MIPDYRSSINRHHPSPFVGDRIVCSTYSANNLVFLEMVSVYARAAMRVTSVFKSDRSCAFSFWLALVLATFVLPARADVLIATNGERFVGKVIEETTNIVVFQSGLSGRLTLYPSEIRKLERTVPGEINAPPPVPVVVATNQPPPTASTNLDWVPPAVGHDDADWI